MKSKKNILLFDAIPYAGGSKIATVNIFRQFKRPNYNIIVVSNDSTSWGEVAHKTINIIEFDCLKNKETGVLFFIRQFVLLLNVIFATLRVRNVCMVVGTSGPGVDFPLYWYKLLFGTPFCQLIHGPVACSKSIGKVLNSANLIASLSSAKKSVISALARYLGQDKAVLLSESEVFIEFDNGLSEESWPTFSSQEKPTVYWAASLLKWKGLSLFEKALAKASNHSQFETNICFIRPKHNALPVDPEPSSKQNIHVYECPSNLDSIRANSSIFVSTSDKEPFGLSILEALAAGLCVIIPEDGAYWDSCLKHGIHCMKYSAKNSSSLADVIRNLVERPELVKTIGHNGAVYAQAYTAERVYAPLVNKISVELENYSGVTVSQEGYEI